MGNDIERAVVITHDWSTGETLHTDFSGEGAGVEALAFKEGEEERGDFTAPDWVWFLHANEEATVAIAQVHMKRLGIE